MTETEVRQLAEKFLEEQGVEYEQFVGMHYLERVDRADGVYYDSIDKGKRIISDTPNSYMGLLREGPELPSKLWCLSFSTSGPNLPPHIISSLITGFMVWVDDETGYCEKG